MQPIRFVGDDVATGVTEPSAMIDITVFNVLTSRTCIATMRRQALVAELDRLSNMEWSSTFRLRFSAQD